MARKKSSAFVGSTVFDVDVDAPSFTRVLENAVGDTALVFDKVTGEHSEADTINHGGGAGRGSLLGMPLVNQLLKRPIGTDYTAGGTKVGKDGGTGATYLLAVPVFIPPGEDEIVVEVAGDLGDLQPYAYVRSTAAFAVVGDEATVALAPVGDPATSGLWRARLTGLAAAGLCLLFVEVDVIDIDTGDSGLPAGREIEDWRVYVDRKRAPVQIPRRASTTVVGVSTPGSADGVANTAFDETLFADLLAYNGYLTALENRNQNGLAEYITGWPAAGNASYKHVDHNVISLPDATDPARSRFMAHTRSLYSAEPEIPFPLWCEAFGAFKLDGGLVVEAAEPPTYGMTGWYAPWPTSGASTVMRQGRIAFPDFQTASSRLKMAILVGFDSGTIADWDGSCGQSGSEGVGAFAAVSGASKLALATATGLTFTADSVQTVRVLLEKTRAAGARTIDSIVLLGACLYYEP